MPDPSSSAVPPELQVILDLDLTIEGLNSAFRHQRLEATLVDVPGIESISLADNKVTIRYDPEKLTKAHVCKLLTAAGFPIAESASAPPAPPVG